MKINSNICQPHRAFAGMTLIEVVVAAGVGSLVLTSAVVLFIYGVFSFAGLGNYAILTGQSRVSIDTLSREMREATQLLAASPSVSPASLASRFLTFTNALQGTTFTYRWDPFSRIMRAERPGVSTNICLTGCDDWQFTLYQRTPNANWTFYSTTDLTTCKLINMSWKCSRSILGRKINTEEIVTAEVVLRNKP